MRILFYHTAREWDGSGRAMAALARGLSERGHSVTVACQPDGAVEQHLEFGVYEVLPLGSESSVPLAARRLRRSLQERFIQVVCVHTNEEHVVAATAARLAERAAVLRRVQVGEQLRLDHRARLAIRFTSTGFVFGTEEDARAAPRIRHARLAPVVVPLGIPVPQDQTERPAICSALDAEAGTRILVCPYDGTDRNRVAHVLRVVALLAPRHPELRLVLVGPGSDDEDLRMHAAALRIARSVSFLGPCDDVLPLYSRADLGWVMARGDDGAYAVLDLLGSRVPVIAERGTLAERYVPDGIAGLLLWPGDPHGAAAAIARLLAHDEQREAMGGAGHNRAVRDYGVQAMVDAFERAAIAASDRSLW